MTIRGFILIGLLIGTLPILSFAEPYADGKDGPLFRIQKGDKYGHIDAKGMEKFTGGLARVTFYLKNSYYRYGYCNIRGRLVWLSDRIGPIRE